MFFTPFPADFADCAELSTNIQSNYNYWKLELEKEETESKDGERKGDIEEENLQQGAW